MCWVSTRPSVLARSPWSGVGPWSCWRTGPISLRKTWEKAGEKFEKCGGNVGERMESHENLMGKADGDSILEEWGVSIIWKAKAKLWNMFPVQENGRTCPQQDIYDKQYEWSKQQVVWFEPWNRLGYCNPKDGTKHESTTRKAHGEFIWDTWVSGQKPIFWW